MLIYNSGSHGRATIFVTPGSDHPETSEWVKATRDDEGREYRQPLQFVVKFEDGVADVADNLGRYLLDKGLAKKSPQKIIVASPVDIPRKPPLAVGRPLNEIGA